MDLGAEEIRRGVRVLTRLARVLRRADTGLTMPQYKLLVLLDNGDERSSRLAAQLAVSKPTITAAADGLLEMGHIRRSTDQSDKRAVWLQLTDGGRAALRRADAAYAERFGPLFESTSDPRRLITLLDEVGATLDAERADRIQDADAAQPSGHLPPAANTPTAKPHPTKKVSAPR